MSALTDRFDRIRERLSGAAARSGRVPESVRLVAVSKTRPAADLADLAAYWSAFGAPLFGESYMQEAREKMPDTEALLKKHGLPSPQWHFIGHVQSKKARDLAGRFSLIHSVDSVKLAQALQKAWQSRVAEAPRRLDEGKPGPQEILIQVNVGREPQKSGVEPEGLEELLTAVAAMPELRPRGLMCLPPLQEIGEHSRPYFIMLRQLRDNMEQRCGLALPDLSMGMSDDFEAAVEEGATLVRIGTDIFGPRGL